MTPEEKFNQDIWWILQEIKKEEYITSKGQKVEFYIKKALTKNGSQNKNIDYNFPQEQVQKKLLYKLQEWNVISIEPVNDILRGSDIFSPSIYDLIIKKPKFNKLYKKYETENNSRENEHRFKPILRKLESGKLPYREDGLFYSLWKYTNASRLTGKGSISFIDLVPLKKGSPQFAIWEFVNILRELKIELEDITFHEDIYKSYCKTEYEYILDYIAKNPKTGLSKAMKKIFKNQATFEDIFQVFGSVDGFIKFKMRRNGLLDFIEFSALPSKKNIKSLQDYLEVYLNCFIEDRLFCSESKNFYKFLRQKDIFLQNIEREVKDYGLEFVFRQNEIVAVGSGSVVSINKDESYLFIHILAALEKQGYFEIERILITDMDVSPESQTDDYKIKIIANVKLLEEYNQKNVSIVLNKEKTEGKNKISLSGIKFNDNETELCVNTCSEIKKCKIPPFKNEHYFCRAMFKYPPKEPVDWSLIGNEILGSITDERRN